MRISMMAAAASVGLVVTASVGTGCGGGGSTGTGAASSASATTGTGGAIPSTTGSATTTTSGSGGMATGTTSSVGSTGTGSCIPKTCLTLAVEIAGDAGVDAGPIPDACGILSDGCANFIDCGGCASPFQSCGGTAPKSNSSWPGPGQGGVANLCGGGCTALDAITAEGATTCLPSVEAAVNCSAPTDGMTNQPPGWTACHADSDQVLPTQVETFWCCKP